MGGLFGNCNFITVNFLEKAFIFREVSLDSIVKYNKTVKKLKGWIIFSYRLII